MKKKVLKAISLFSLLKEGDEVTVALSGGADSMSLLYILTELRSQLGITIKAAHFNHSIRGTEALRDENFVREECRRLDIDFFCERGNVPEYANKHRLSMELAAREMRYDFLKRVSCGGLVATAHTANDNLETVLLNLVRGTSIKGLCGIPIKREIFIRPLIFCTRNDIEEYCRQKKISFVTDSTNLSDDYTRNNIRHNIIPIIKQMNPSIENTVLRSCLSLTEDCDFMEKLAQEAFNVAFINTNSLNVQGISKLHSAVAKRVILRFYNKNIFSDVDSFHINAIYDICINGGRTSLPNNKYAVCCGGILKIFNMNEKKASVYNYSVKIIEAKNVFFEKNKKVNNLFLNNTLDCDKIVGKLVIRSRQSGDTIRLRNRNCTKTLKKLYNEYGIPIEKREYIPVIADEEGVIWVYGIGVAERCAVDKNSKKIFRVYTDISNKC